MDLIFDIGRSDKPKGHAVVYFGSATAGQRLLASYCVVLPIALDLTKFVPPAFMTNMPQMGLQNITVIPLPPLPVEAESYEQLRTLATRRDDDLVQAGTFASSDPTSLLGSLNEACQQYANLYAAAARQPEAVPEPELLGKDILYSVMSEKEKLGELTRLVGMLRYALDGRDARQADEDLKEMEVLVRYLPAKYRGADVLNAARTPGERGNQLTELHIRRCYKLADEDYSGLDQIENEITELRKAE
ncbi:MAG: hypothetical protein EPO21_01390 [Chloroflexota bacterium]|nr:MAG: hypothetical protein EPO21_01390 [Chloroflexota bacterium]